jgi:hypothetical protein
MLSDHQGWVDAGTNVKQIVTILGRYTAKSIEWALSGQVNKGYRSIVQKCRRHYSCTDEAPSNTSSQNSHQGCELEMGSYNSATRQSAAWIVRMDPQMFEEQHNQCVKTASAAQAILGIVTNTGRDVRHSVSAIELACDQVVALYAIELRWYYNKVGIRDDLQLLFN